jgi:hypothetical protein
VKPQIELLVVVALLAGCASHPSPKAIARAQAEESRIQQERTHPDENATLVPKPKKPSALMTAVLTRLRAQHAFTNLDSWERLPSLPTWVREKAAAAEWWAPSGIYPAMDSFHYTVIAAKDRRTIVLRTGGFAGVYQVFQENEPTKAVEPAPTSTTSPAEHEPPQP